MKHLFGRSYTPRIRINGVFKNIMAPHTTPEGEEQCVPLPLRNIPAWWLEDEDLTRLCAHLGIRTIAVEVNGKMYTFLVTYYECLGRLPDLELLVKGIPVTVPQPLMLTMPSHFRNKPDAMATRLAQIYTGLADPWHERYFSNQKCVYVLKHGDWEKYACGLTEAC